MSKVATKARDNVWYEARYNAAKKYHNDKLLSREGAAEEAGIDRTRLAKIELDTIQPYPEEAVILADVYHAPELRYRYCRECCPLGKNMPEIEEESLDRLTIKTLARMDRLQKDAKTLLDIVSDGSVSPIEREELQKVIQNMDGLNEINQNLKVWLEKNGG